MVHYQGGKFHPGLGRDHQLGARNDLIVDSLC